jgi:hypothetical protein
MTRRRFLVVLALVPALLSGCSLLPGSSAGRPDGGSSVAEGDAAAGPSWIVATQGSATPSPRPSYGATAPTPAATGGFLPPGTPAAAGTPTATCSPNTFRFSRIDSLDVTPGPTSAVLSWYNVGGYNLTEFRLYAISQDLTVGSQRDVGYVTVKPTTPCGRMSATIRNLDRATAYVFSVDAVVVRRSGHGTHAATVARSHAVSTR